MQPVDVMDSHVFSLTGSIQSVSYIPATSVACASLLVYDYICTLDREVEDVWSRPRSFTALLFFSNRYLPFIDTLMQMDLVFGPNNSIKKCTVNNIVMTWFIVIGVFVSEMILTVRTYAFWRGDRRILFLFMALIVALGIPSAVMAQVQMSTLTYVIDDYGSCKIDYANPIAIGTYIILIIYESCIAILTVVKASQQRTNSPWVIRLYSESFIFYFYLLAVSLMNLILPIMIPSVVQRSAGPMRVLHSIFCNRIIFTIVGHRPAGTPRSMTPVLSSVVTENDLELDHLDRSIT